MTRNPIPAAAFIVALTCFSSLPISAQTPIPALVQEPTDLRIPGDFLWNDLFASEPEASAGFYSSLFGWTIESVGAGKNAYLVFYNDGTPVAGVVQGPRVSQGDRGGRWIPYVSVENVKKSVAKTTANGGRVLLAAADVPDRGEQAIVADSEGAILGLLRTSTGDPEDFLPEIGNWVWLTVFSNDPVKMTGFYEKVVGYTAHDDTRTEVEGDFILGSSGSARASLYPLSEDSEYRPEWVGFVRVNDVNAAVSLVKNLGGRVLMDPRGTERGNLLTLVADPDGAIFGMAEITPETEEVLSE